MANITAIIRILDALIQSIQYVFGMIDKARFEHEMDRIKANVKQAGEGSIENRIEGGSKIEGGFNSHVKKCLPFFFLLSLYSCYGNAPSMEKTVKYWNGVPEMGAICTTKTGDAIIDRYITSGDNVCLYTNEEAFKKYGCMTHEDMGVIQAYIEKLIYSCKKWK